MRTTLDLDDDVLIAARSLSEQRHQSIGKVVSDLARQALRPRPKTKKRNGMPLLPVKRGTQPVTMAIINELRDAESGG